MSFSIEDFVRESNRIEGIQRAPTQKEIDATAAFLALPAITISDLESLVNVYAPGHVLRDKEGLNVRVGSHIAPSGGMDIRVQLQRVLSEPITPWGRHTVYETLHPFTDGNGRSGRALWLHNMGGIERAPLGFLHHFYYQTLEVIGR